jgi:uncharacterized protein (DUF1778 family)
MKLRILPAVALFIGLLPALPADAASGNALLKGTYNGISTRTCLIAPGGFNETYYNNFAPFRRKAPRMTETTERVDLRMTPAAKRTLQRAAAVNDKTLTEFVLDSSLSAAFETLADRRVFPLDEVQWAAFTAALDMPPQDNPRLRQLLATKARPGIVSERRGRARTVSAGGARGRT